MSGEVRLTPDEQQLADKLADAGPTQEMAEEWLRQILTARLAPVEALAETWEADPDGLPRADGCARQLRALAPQPAPGESGGAS